MISQHLIQTLNATKNKIGLVGGSLNVQEYDETPQNIAAHIAPEGWGIEMKVRKGFNPIAERRQRGYARKKKIKDGLETVLNDVLHHECGHWELPLGTERGCPFDIYYHDKILEAVKGALPKEKKGQASYVVNAFEDVLVNARCKEFKGDFSGQVLFWDNEGLSFKKEGKKSFTPFYEAFVKLNLHCIGDSLDTMLVKRHYTDEKRVNSAVEQVVKGLQLPKDVTKQGTAQLFDKQRWPAMAAAFAKYLAPLLDNQPHERLSAFDEGNGEGEQGEDSEQKPAGNGIEQKIGTPEGTEQIAFGRYAGGEALSKNIESHEQLDAIYRHLAKDIVVKVDAMTRSRSLAIAPLTFRAFDPKKDDPLKIKVSRLVPTDEGITFSYPQQPLVIDARFKMQRKSFPDFKMVVLDSSGSMAEGMNGSEGSKTAIPWGDNSKYHYALLGFYGIENFLQRQGVAPYITHGVALFSSQTRYKESDFNGLDDVRKLALSPEFGGTQLDAGILTKALKGRESFVLSISDGEIGNWEAERDEFRKLASQNYYAHIHLGGNTEFTNDLESWKIPVFYVKSGNDLAHLMVDLTKRNYERFTKQ